jgi:predicted nucleic acid-binding protein
MYLDSAYVAKYYLNERDSKAVRSLMEGASSLVSSEWSMLEVTCAFHRHFREGHLTARQFRELARAFRKHAEQGLWSFVPVDTRLLRRVAVAMDSLPGDVYLRAGDAIQLASAQEAGEHEIWSSDRHVRAAAAHFSLVCRSV